MTGWGENIVRVGAARHCVQLVEDGGYSPEVACRKTIRYYQNHIYRPRAEPVGIICIDGTGRFGVSQTGVRMSWVHVGKEGYDSLQSAGKYSGELIRSRL
jgi:isoaspartyl peptidase/L-asparaginase-like protein (Ntn-hydrolase superfamily)